MKAELHCKPDGNTVTLQVRAPSCMMAFSSASQLDFSSSVRSSVCGLSGQDASQVYTRWRSVCCLPGVGRCQQLLEFVLTNVEDQTSQSPRQRTSAPSDQRFSPGSSKGHRLSTIGAGEVWVNRLEAEDQIRICLACSVKQCRTELRKRLQRSCMSMASGAPYCEQKQAPEPNKKHVHRLSLLQCANSTNSPHPKK